MESAEVCAVRQMCLRTATTTTLRMCAWECVSVCALHSDTGRPELVFRMVYKTCSGTSDEVGYGDCRDDCDDEESLQEDLVEGDHVHDDRECNCFASGSEDCLVKFPLFHGTLCSCSEWCSVFTVLLALFWMELYDLALISVVNLL